MLPVNQFGNRCRDCSAPVAGRAWSVIGLNARMLRPSKPAFSFSQFVFRSAAAFLLLAACSVARAEDQPSVGMVTKAENEAQVDSGSGTITASVGTVVHMKDMLTNGPKWAAAGHLPGQKPADARRNTRAYSSTGMCLIRMQAWVTLR